MERIKTNGGDILHRVKAKLYRNTFGKGLPWIARTANNRVLHTEDICQIMIDRGGYGGNEQGLRDTCRQFIEEILFCASDGFAVTLDNLVTIYPRITGSFYGMGEEYDPEKNPVVYKFRAAAKLRRLAKQIVLEFDSLYHSNAHIDTFTDTDEGVVNDYFEPGNHFILRGPKLKIEGDDSECGVWFVPVTDPSAKVKARVAKSSASEIVGTCPNTLHTENRIQVVTRYAGGSLLKDLRVIESDFTVTAM